MLDRMKGMREHVHEAANGVVETAGALAESAAGLAEAAVDKLNHFLADFYEVLPTINALGLSIDVVQMKFGLMPEAHAQITGALEAIEEDQLKDLLAAKAQNKMLVPILQAFRTLALLKRPLSAVGFKGVRVDLTVGMVPAIAVEMLR